MNAYTQPPMGAPTVFGFTAPSHRAPGSNLQAPEQKLMSSDEMSRRLGLDWNIQKMQSLADAGCDVAALQAAYEKGEDAMLDLLEARFMRGSMPQPVRQGIKSALKGQGWMKETASRHFGGMIALLSMTPGFGASK